jgi:hypothetical protein
MSFDDFGPYGGHPADPRTEPLPDYAVAIAAEQAMSKCGHWVDFLVEHTDGDLSEVKTWRIKPEDVVDCDTATLLVLAITGTNEQANAARMYLSEGFIEHHAQLLDEMAHEVLNDKEPASTTPP